MATGRSILFPLPRVLHLCLAPLFWAVGAWPATAATAMRIPLRVEEVLGQARSETVTSGIPLPRGVLREAGQAQLADGAGRPLPMHARALSRWPDGSLKWLLIQVPATVPANGRLEWSLVVGGKPARPHESVRVVESPHEVVVTTGPMRFSVPKRDFGFLGQVWVDANRNGRFEASEDVLHGGPSWMEFEHTAPHAPQEENWLWDAAGGPRERFVASPESHAKTPREQRARSEGEAAQPGTAERGSVSAGMPGLTAGKTAAAGGASAKTPLAGATAGAAAAAAPTRPEQPEYTVKVEEAGPARAVVVARGFYRNGARKIAPFWIRYTACAGEARIDVEHFFAFDGDPKTDFLRTLALRLRPISSTPLSVTFGAQSTAAFAVPKDLAEVSLHEEVPDRFYTCVPYTVDRSVPFLVEGLAGPMGPTRTYKPDWRALARGKEASGWVRVRGSRGTVTVALRDFWQLHPKEIRVAPRAGDLDILLWPERSNKVLDLRRRYEGNDDAGHYDLGWYPEMGRGVGKTHQMLLDFSGAPALQTWAAAQEPLRAFCTPQHYADTGLWGPFAVADPARFPRWEARADAGMEWLLRLPSVFHWDGMIDWGDTLFNGYEAAGHGQVKDVPKGSWVVRGYDGWMNNDCSFAEGILLHFLRTGDLRAWHRFERMVQHVNDVDTVHCSANPRLIGGGHRHDEQHWGNIVTGYGTAGTEAAELYFFTGRQGAKEAACKTADWYLGGDWGEWPNRVATLVRAWEATGDERYFKALAPEALEEDYYTKSLHQPFFRSHATITGMAFYAAAMPNDWARTVIRRATRRMVDESMGNGSGLNLLAIACVQEKDPELRDWLRRFLASYDCYSTPVIDAFDYKKLMPGRAADVSFDALQQLVRTPGFSLQNCFGIAQGVLYQFPYVMRALADGGLTEKDRYLADAVYKRRGWGWEWGMRGAKLPALPECHFETLSLAGAANRNPLADPLEEKDRAPSPSALKPGEIGFQFQESGPPVPGYLPVRWGTLYPRSARLPMPAEHDDRNLCGLPYGTVFQANGIPFDLPDPHRAPGGRTILVAEDGQSAVIPLGKSVRRLHFLGHVGRKMTTLKEVGARYLMRYADGEEQRVDLVNMAHFEHILYWGFCKETRFARNWKLHGGWDGDPFLIYTFSVEAKEKPLKEVVVEDTGKGYGFLLLGVTAEVAGASAEKPVRSVRFGAGSPGAAKNAWKEGSQAGWTAVDLPLEQGAGQVFSHGRATWRMAVPDGDYDLELEISGWGGNLGVNVLANGRLAVQSYCPTHQPAPGSDGFTETVRFPVRATAGRLDVTLANDAGAGTWWHPAPIATSKWALWSLSLYPARTPAPPPLPEIVYGFVERDIAWERHPWNIDREATLDLAKTCLRSRSPRGTFRADVPAGTYEMEMILGHRGGRQQGQNPKMNVTVQGQRVLAGFVSPLASEAQRPRYPVTVAPGRPLELLFEPAGEGTEWGINALILRPAK